MRSKKYREYNRVIQIEEGAEQMSYCVKCGAKVDDGIAICPQCGAPIPDLSGGYSGSGQTRGGDNGYRQDSGQEYTYGQPGAGQGSYRQGGYGQPENQQGSYGQSEYWHDGFGQPGYQQNGYGQSGYETRRYGAADYFDEMEVRQNKAMGVLSYLGILVLIPLLAGNRQSQYVKHHTNQGLTLFLLSSLVDLVEGDWVWGLHSVIHFGGGIFSWIFDILGLVFFILMVMGIVAACRGERKELPLIGKIKFFK